MTPATTALLTKLRTFSERFFSLYLRIPSDLSIGLVYEVYENITSFDEPFYIYVFCKKVP